MLSALYQTNTLSGISMVLELTKQQSMFIVTLIISCIVFPRRIKWQTCHETLYWPHIPHQYEVNFISEDKGSIQLDIYHDLFIQERFENTKGVSRRRKSKKDRQHNGKKKKYKRTYNTMANRKKTKRKHNDLQKHRNIMIEQREHPNFFIQE